MLESIGFEWVGPNKGTPRNESAWNKRFTELKAYKDKYGRTNVPWLHIDVHSFSSDAPRLPAGWGRGVNIITLCDDDAQARSARHMQRVLNNHVPSAPKSHVVSMDRYPTTDTDDNSNAQTEWSRSRGMMSLLVEFPVHSAGQRQCSDDSCWLCSYADAAVYADALADYCTASVRK